MPSTDICCFSLYQIVLTDNANQTNQLKYKYKLYTPVCKARCAEMRISFCAFQWISQFISALVVVFVEIKGTCQYKLKALFVQMRSRWKATQSNTLTTTDWLKLSFTSREQAVRELCGSSTLSSIFNEPLSNEPLLFMHHLYMMSTHVVIWSSTLRASFYRACVTLKLNCFALFMSRYISQHTELWWAAQET